MLTSDVFPIYDVFPKIPYVLALIQVSVCVADISHIAQITLKKVNNALLVNNRGFAFFWPDVGSDLLGCTRDRYLFRFCDLILQVVFA